jgi:hypothetical protein
LYSNAVVADVFDFPRDDKDHSVLISISVSQYCGIVIFIDGVIKGEGNCLSLGNKWAGGFGGRYGITGPSGQFDEPINAWPTSLGPLKL